MARASRSPREWAARPSPSHRGGAGASPVRARVITTMKYRFNGEGFTYDRRPHVFVRVRRRRRAAPDHRRRHRRRRSRVVARRPRDRVHLGAPRRRATATTAATSGSCPPSGRRAARRRDRHRGPRGHPRFSPDGARLAYLGRARAQRLRAQRPRASPSRRGRRARRAVRADSIDRAGRSARRRSGRPTDRRVSSAAEDRGTARRLPVPPRAAPVTPRRRRRARDHRLLGVRGRPHSSRSRPASRLPRPRSSSATADGARRAAASPI